MWTRNYLLSYVSDIPYGGYLLEENKKTAAEIIVTVIASIPSEILNKGDLIRLNGCCLEIWEKLQNSTLWTSKREIPMEAFAQNVDLTVTLDDLQKIISQRDPMRRDRTHAIIHMSDCILKLNDIQRSLIGMATKGCAAHVSNLMKMAELFKNLLWQPGLTTQEKQDLGEYILCVIARSSDDVLGKEYRFKLFSDIEKMGIVPSITLRPLTYNLRINKATETQTKEESQNMSVEDEIVSLRIDAQNGEPMDPSNYEKLFPGCQVCCVDNNFDPENIKESGYEDFGTMNDDGRSQDVSKGIQLSMDPDEIEGNFVCDLQTDSKEVVSGDIAYCIGAVLSQMRTDISALDYFGGKLYPEVIDKLVDYFSHIPYAERLLPEDKEVVVGKIIFLVVNTPESVLNKGDWKKLNTCCFQLWDELQKGTLWKGKHSSKIEEVTSEKAIAR